MKLHITVEGQTYEVEVVIVEQTGGAPTGPQAPAPAAAPAPRPVAPPPVAAPPPPPPAPAAAAPAAPAAAGKNAIPAPLAGTITSIKVNIGDAVQSGDVVLILEAMKMETSVSASRAGKVTAILVAPGDRVEAGQGLVEVE